MEIIKIVPNIGTNIAIYGPVFDTTRNLLVFFQHFVEKNRNGFSTYGAKYWVIHQAHEPYGRGKKKEVVTTRRALESFRAYML